MLDLFGLAFWFSYLFSCFSISLSFLCFLGDLNILNLLLSLRVSKHSINFWEFFFSLFLFLELFCYCCFNSILFLFQGCSQYVFSLRVLNTVFLEIFFLNIHGSFFALLFAFFIFYLFFLILSQIRCICQMFGRTTGKSS